MEKETNVRGTVRKLHKRQSVTFTLEEAKPTYIRNLCSQLGIAEKKVFRVEAKKDTGFIKVTRVK